MSRCKLFPVLLVILCALGVTVAPVRAQGVGVVIDDIQLVGVNYDPVAGLLTAAGGTVSGTVAGQPFTTGLDNFALQFIGAGGACSVLDLALGPIDLDLLGLHVDTSPICLEITAFAGQGLLGDLLCGLAGGNLLLLPDLLAQLPGLLTSALSQPAGGAGPDDICDGACIVLDLSLGPVDLTLLGLNVYLHDCEDGPVQVCVSASQGEGLLGDLLCGLAGGGGLLDLANLIRLLDAITGIEGLEDIQATARQIATLVNILEAALRDGQLSARELRVLVRAIERLI